MDSVDVGKIVTIEGNDFVVLDTVIKENKKKSNQFHKRNNRIISNAQNITNRKSSKDKSHSLLFLKTEKINVRKDSNLEQNNQKKPLLKNINGLNLDLNFYHLINIKDEDVDKKE